MAGRLSAGAGKAPRRGVWLAVLVAVVLAHVVVTDELADSVADWTREARMPERMQVAFVRELKAAAPLPASGDSLPSAARADAPKPRARPRPVVVAQAAAAASAAAVAAEAAASAARDAAELAMAAASAVEADAEPALAQADAAASAPQGEPPVAGDTAPASAGAQDAAASAVAQDASVPSSTGAAASPGTASASAPPLPALVQAARERFAWPPSTRMSYKLTGFYRGDVQGTAQVEWIHVGKRYQMHLDVSIGPSFAPVMSRRMSSEGETSAQGLAPTRYDEETRVAFRDTRLATILFEPDSVVLPGKLVRTRDAGVQDAASQFVQLTWMFTTQPSMLEPGQVIEFPLALPRRVEPWVYDVVGPATLNTPIGPIETVHVKPRRPPRASSDLSAEVWFAPSLQYLPVRIVIHSDATTFIDLLVDSAPLQAADPVPVKAAPYSPAEPKKDPP